MTDHPLTDEICDLLDPERKRAGDFANVFSFADLRAAYDLAVEHITEQWEEVINSPRTDIRMIREFDKRLKAMRPQEES